jgi:hypothetical protein
MDREVDGQTVMAEVIAAFFANFYGSDIKSAATTPDVSVSSVILPSYPLFQFSFERSN